MRVHNYKLTKSVAGFDDGEILDVTARFGDWHTYQLKLEPKTDTYRSRTVVVTDSTGFSEAAILDETARFGDWHEYDLTFDPGTSASQEPSGRIELTMDEFERVVEPADATA